jgi:hypothetical protein
MCVSSVARTLNPIARASVQWPDRWFSGPTCWFNKGSCRLYGSNNVKYAIVSFHMYFLYRSIVSHTCVRLLFILVVMSIFVVALLFMCSLNLTCRQDSLLTLLFSKLWRMFVLRLDNHCPVFMVSGWPRRSCWCYKLVSPGLYFKPFFPRLILRPWK